MLVFINRDFFENATIQPVEEKLSGITHVPDAVKVTVKSNKVVEDEITTQVWHKSYPEILEWNKLNFGKFDEFILSNSDYKGYDIELLESLSEQGDFVAMHVLGWKYYGQLDFKNAKRIYMLAAINGSTSALESLAKLENGENKTKNIKQFLRENAISRLAYYQVALLRGDSSFLTNASVDIKEFKLSDVELVMMQNRGKNIYNKLELQREKRGLGGFNTNMPLNVSRYYSSFSHNYKYLFNGDKPSLIWRTIK